MEYIIATHNMKKRNELARILEPLGVSVLTAEQAGVELTDVEETGETFEENARLKSQSGCKESGLPCIADDSGLMVDALNGEPGVYSARYAGEHGNDPKNNALLLEKLTDVPDEKRTARFVCAMCLLFPDGRKIETFGTSCDGYIINERRGENGFGYDPVFFAPEYGKTFSEMSMEEKNRVSHRKAALCALSEELKGE